MVKLAVALLAASVVSCVFADDRGTRTLTLDERARAESVIGPIDAQRRAQLAEAPALEERFGIAPTDEMLAGELARLTREISPPERLSALYDALENDPFLIRECLARPSLVDRLSRDRYAFDPELQAAAHREAQALRRRLVSGELNPWVDHPGRTVFELARSGKALERVSDLVEERDGFVLSVVLSETTDEIRVAKYVVPKLSFDAWRGNASSPTTSPTGAAGTAPDRDLFSFCATGGGSIDLAVLGSASSPELLDASGEPLATEGLGFKAPYTGLYFAQVPRGPSPTRDEYLLSIGGDGATRAQEIADLSVMTTVAPNVVEAGGLATLTIVLHNAGPDIASDTEMLEWPPENTTFESITVPAGDRPWNCVEPRAGGRGKVSCTTKCLAPGSTATFTITVRVDNCAGERPMTATVTASSFSIEPEPSDNTSLGTFAVVDSGLCDDHNFCTAGDQCGSRETFDGVSAPFLPSGWTASLLVGPPGARSWETRGGIADTEPNTVFVADAPDIRDAVLDSPPLLIVSTAAQLRFRNRYSLEINNDGGVLEISIDGEGFLDIEAAGGVFVEGGYTPGSTISRNFGSPLAGRRAWTGIVSQFVPTTVNLPPAAAGKIVILRWRLATDRTLGYVGQWIDTVVVTGRDVCLAGTEVACDDGNFCTADACDPRSGCVHVSLSCDDGNPCTHDVCDATVQCVHTNSTSACDDGNACTLADFCAAGACVGTNAIVCHDADGCTADGCDPTLGCVETTADFEQSGFSAGRVDGRDLAVFAKAYDSCSGSARYNPSANLDRQEDCIREADFHLFMDAFGQTCASSESRLRPD